MNEQFSRKCRDEKLLKVREEYRAALMKERNRLDQKIWEIEQMIQELKLRAGAR